MAGSGKITNDGIKIALDRFTITSPTRGVISEFKVGTGTTVASVTDTDLQTPIPISGTESIDPFDDASLWTAGTDSVLADNIVTFKENNKSMSVAKTGTTGTVFSASKTVTSLDFTSKTLNIWVWFLDITDLVASGTAITIRYGSDSSNYFTLDVAIGSLANGWNAITFTSATATSTTGSPVLTAMDFLGVFFKTDLAADTVVADRVLLDDAKLSSTGDYTKILEAGFPTIDFSTLQATYRTRLSTTQANGFLISETGLFNTDSTPLIATRNTFTGFSKSNTDEFIFVTKMRFTQN